MIRQRESHVANGEPAVVLDIPLLFESKLFDYVDKVLVVYVEPEVQLERLMERDESGKEEALSRIQSQISITEKKDRADAIIDNTDSVDHSREQLKDILREWGIENKIYKIVTFLIILPYNIINVLYYCRKNIVKCNIYSLGGYYK